MPCPLTCTSCVSWPPTIPGKPTTSRGPETVPTTTTAAGAVARRWRRRQGEAAAAPTAMPSSRGFFFDEGAPLTRRRRPPPPVGSCGVFDGLAQVFRHQRQQRSATTAVNNRPNNLRSTKRVRHFLRSCSLEGEEGGQAGGWGYN